MSEPAEIEEFITQRRCQDVLADWQCTKPDGHDGPHEACPGPGRKLTWSEN